MAQLNNGENVHFSSSITIDKNKNIPNCKERKDGRWITQKNLSKNTMNGKEAMRFVWIMGHPVKEAMLMEIFSKQVGRLPI